MVVMAEVAVSRRTFADIDNATHFVAGVRSQRGVLSIGYSLTFALHSVKRTAAVDRQRRAGDKGRLRAGEEEDSLRDLHRLCDALERIPTYFALKARSHWRVHHAGAHAVD